MRPRLQIVLTVCILICTFSATAQDDKTSTREQKLKLLNGLKYEHGEINLRGGLAKLNVPPEFKYLGPGDTETLLVKLWGNPPGTKTLGLLMPADTTPTNENCWVVTISFTEDGYVKDGDAGKINYDDLLKEMKKGTREASAEREKKGYPAVELVGWAAPPRYDTNEHKLYWAKELKFDDGSENTLNYNIRLLGRRGVLVLNAVSTMSQIEEIKKQTPAILSMVNFNDGNRYADFDPKVDKVATYGIAALVAGGIAAKLGFFKLIWVFILAAKKIIIIGVAAVVAGIKKLFAKNKNPGV